VALEVSDRVPRSAAQRVGGLRLQASPMEWGHMDQWTHYSVVS
jgi:hypothetical protein